MRTRDIVVYSGIAIGAYFLWKKFSGVIGDTASAVSKPIANLYVQLTSPTAPLPQGQVLMPDGSTFPAANLTDMHFGFVGNVAQFIYGGLKYSLSPHDANGNYAASIIN